MNFFKLAFLILTVFTLAVFVQAQNPGAGNQEIAEAIEKDGCAITDEGLVKICKLDYKFRGKKAEALSFRPVESRKYPGSMLIPGYQVTPQR